VVSLTYGMLPPQVTGVSRLSPALSPLRRSRGRPRSFDIDEALDKAIRVFRERGYKATSISDLTGAMALASGSIYKAFRDKRAVFLAAFDRYTLLGTEQLRRVVDMPKSGHERLRDVLAFYAEKSRGAEGQRGCLVVGSAVEFAIRDPDVAARVKASLARNEAFLTDLIRQGQSDGSISARVDAEATACALVCLTQGIRVVGKAGRPPPDAKSFVEIAMKLLA
jgi:TetR/AcrR family transcriptional regulator, transcriptional repressor for nem operon